MMTVEKVREALAQVKDPVLDIDFVSARMLGDVQVDDAGGVTLTLKAGYPTRTWGPKAGDIAAEAVKAAGATSVTVRVVQDIIAHKVQGTTKVMPGIKNIIAVSSGKGGVGKSTVTANLALALAAEGARVGVLDADVYGPSQPVMLGAQGQPVSLDGVKMEPMQSYGLQINSVGFLVAADEPMIWRGPMAAGALTQLLNETNWQDLDYLVVDMPPGTGDIQLTLSQTVPLTGAIVVTTPQDIALIDAKKGLRMFQKVNVPILGVVENMSLFVCPTCGEMHRIFGEGGALGMSRDYGVPLLGELPLSMRIREEADAGKPTVVSDPESPEAKLYRDIAMKVAATVAKLGKDYTAKMPKVTIADKKSEATSE